MQHWNRQVQHWLSGAVGATRLDGRCTSDVHCWSPRNDYGCGVHNGDAGVVVQTSAGQARPHSGAKGLVDFAVSRMSEVETMFATSVHRSQGSQATGSRCCCRRPSHRC